MRFLACALLVIATTHAEKVCKPGESKQDGFSPCFCMSDGNGWVCGASLGERPEAKETEETCEPGKYFKRYCNSCFCGPEGIAARSSCTLIDCDPDVWNKDGSLMLSNEIANNPPLRATRETEERCEPGTSYKYYCNTCFCGKNGIADHAACTRARCDLNHWNKDGSLKFPEIAKNPLPRKQRSSDFLCQPGKSYEDDCNTCSCNEDGKSAACSLMYCKPKKEGRVPAPQVCDPKKQFKIGCNECICSDDGLEVTCTDNDCPASKPTFCTPNMPYKDGCNTCVCNSDGSSASCSLEYCTPHHAS